MKTMKLITIAVMMMVGSFISMASYGIDNHKDKDTILINFGKKGKVVIYVDNKEDFNALKSYDIKALLSKLKMFPDSTQHDDYMNDTTFTFDTPVTVNGKTTEQEVHVKIESLDEKTKGISENLEKAAANIQEATQKLEKITIDLGKLHVGVNEQNGQSKVKITTNSNGHSFDKKKKHYFEFHLGLNNYFQNDHFPVNESTPYALDMWRSRYFAIDFLNREKIVGGWSFIYGIELAFNNYMFRDDVQISKVNGEVAFNPIQERKVKKSKLATTYLNIPIMTKIKLGKFKIGAGGYVGYRLGSHSKIKYASGDNNKVKNRSDFYLNDWRYGLRGTVGFKSIEFFANYDLNYLFKSNRQPQLNSFSFGIIL